jgi:hemerythrin
MLQFLNDIGDSSSNHIEDTLKNWVINHILTSDKEMGLMVQEQESVKTKLRQ